MSKSYRRRRFWRNVRDAEWGWLIFQFLLICGMAIVVVLLGTLLAAVYGHGPMHQWWAGYG